MPYYMWSSPGEEAQYKRYTKLAKKDFQILNLTWLFPEPWTHQKTIKIRFISLRVQFEDNFGTISNSFA